MDFHDGARALNIVDQKRRPLIGERSFTQELLPAHSQFSLRSKKLVNAKKLKKDRRRNLYTSPFLSEKYRVVRRNCIPIFFYFGQLRLQGR